VPAHAASSRLGGASSTFRTVGPLVQRCSRMPPLLAQDPLDALQRSGQLGWLDVAALGVAVACEPWALAIIALALYSWLEREVPSVLKAVVPLVLALVAGEALAAAGRGAWTAPRLAGAGQGAAPLLRLLLGGHAVALGTFVSYSLLAYGRRAATVLGLAALGVAARIWAGPHWLGDLAGGGLAGAALGAAAYLATLRIFPAGHLAVVRGARRARDRGAAAQGSGPLP
jgi:membrane-associated phospholipid phosphatase